MAHTNVGHAPVEVAGRDSSPFRGSRSPRSAATGFVGHGAGQQQAGTVAPALEPMTPTRPGSTARPCAPRVDPEATPGSTSITGLARSGGMGGDAEDRINRRSGDRCDHPSRFGASMPDADRHRHATLVEILVGTARG